MGGLFKKPKMPKPEKPQRMPDKFDEEKEKLNEIEAAQKRSRTQGRRGTDLGGGGRGDYGTPNVLGG